jgi:hypothetical protein
MLMTFEGDRGRCHHMQPVSRDVESVGSAADPEPIEAEEVVDGLPVLAEVRPLERVTPAALPAVQAAAAAATGFVAGAATLALVRRHSARKSARVSARRNAGGLPIVGTRSFLVDVHLIAKPGN